MTVYVEFELLGRSTKAWSNRTGSLIVGVGEHPQVSEVDLASDPWVTVDDADSKDVAAEPPRS